MIKECSTCNVIKSVDEFHKKKGTKDGLHNQCKDCRKKYQQANRSKINTTKREWANNNKDKVAEYNRKSRLKNLLVYKEYQKKYWYSITEDEYQEMLKSQNNKCKICSSSFTLTSQHNKVYVPHIDHCHITGKVRGLLCSKCNQALGLFKDDINIIFNVIKYLQDT